MCSLHRRHTPGNLTLEMHHVIPQAWQRTFTPSSVPPDAVPGHAPDGTPLWDARTMALCPTGHRNVHAWIVLLMRQIARARTEDIQAARRLVHGRRGPAELDAAVVALVRFTAAAGSLVALTDAHQFGEA